mmetsp:Transcript_9723/g.15647  ORF Transcript_9723/g.15647 Transcript_9723/m.15647 type:complete len:156 (+) Transcript_9723:127-594(+)
MSGRAGRGIRGTKSKKKSAGQRKPRRKKGDKPRATDTSRAELTMSVPKIKKALRDGRFAPRLTRTAPIYLAAVLEYCVAEVLELAGNVAKDHKRKMITPRFLMLGIRNDEELNVLTKGVIIPKSGTLVFTHPALIGPAKKKKKKTDKSSGSSQDY